jgi:hypothetical protein
MHIKFCNLFEDIITKLIFHVSKLIKKIGIFITKQWHVHMT